MLNFVHSYLHTNTMNDYYKVTFTLTPGDSDACDLLADTLAEAGFESFEPDDNGSSMVAYVPAASYSPEAVADAVAAQPIPVEISYAAEFVEGRDWNSEWEKNYFKPIVVAGLVAVHSSFHTDVPQAKYDIVFDPPMAFGTGHHATTTLMMTYLLENKNVKGANVIDMGSGTGILAILADMLGAASIQAIEIDPYAAENAHENVTLNLPESHVNVITGDASALDGLDGFADIFLANINRNIITSDICRYAAAMKPGATLTVSGFYVDDRPIVEQAAAAAGLSLKRLADIDNWSSMTFEKTMA